MFVNRIKHSRSGFKLLLISTLILALYDVAPAIAQSATKGNFNDTLSFTSINFLEDTLHAVKRSI